MEKKYRVPASTMIAGLLAWVFFAVMLGMRQLDAAGPWPVVLCLLTGGLIFFSGMRCRKVGGPRLGNLVRTVFLLAMAVYTYVQGPASPALILVVAGLGTLIMTMMPGQPEEANA